MQTRTDSRHPLLAGREGWRVEITYNAEVCYRCKPGPVAGTWVRRANVGSSCGSVRVSLLMHNARSLGGEAVSPTDPHIIAARPIRKVV